MTTVSEETHPPATVIDLQEKVDSLNAEAANAIDKDAAHALRLADDAALLAGDRVFGGQGYLKGLAQCETIRSKVYFAQSDFEAALKHGRSAEYFAEFTEDQKTLAAAYGAAGYAFTRLGNYPAALSRLQKKLPIVMELEDHESIAAAHRGMSGINFETEKFDESVTHAEATLTYATMLGNMPEVAKAYANLCYVYTKVKNYDEAIHSGKQSIELGGEYCSNSLSPFHSNLASAYLGVNDIEKAQVHFTYAVELLGNYPDSFRNAATLFDVAKMKSTLNEYDEAQRYAEWAMELSIESNNPWNLFRSHELLSKLAERQQDFERALYHHQQFQQIQNETIGERNTEQMRYLKISYDVDVAQREAELYRVRTEELEEVVSARTIDLQNALTRERVLAGNLSGALAEARATNELRSNIITTVSHEFRTPLTVINTSTDLLVLRAEQLTSDKREKLGTRIKNAISYLTGLIHDVQLVETASDDRVIVTRREGVFADLCEVLTGDVLQQLGHPQNVTVAFDQSDASLISLDVDLFRQVILSLVSNAVTYSDLDQPICVTIVKGTGGLTATVEDNGVGILREEIDEIFKLLYRGSNISERRGLGSGLYLAKSLVEAMGGTIEAQSEGDGCGALFTVKVPI